MALTTEKTDVFGTVSNTELNKWCTEELKITVNSQVSLERSSTGGLGLFYTPKSQQGDVEILHIPRQSTLSIFSCLKLLKSLSQEEQELTKACLDFYCNGPPSETRILICYIVAFVALERRGGHILGQWSVYLRILLKTTVDNLHADDEVLLESYVQWQPGNSLLNAAVLERNSGETDEFCKFIKEKFGVEVQQKEILQIIAAVRSRTLEIPRKEETEGDKQDKEDDFVTDVTLVPVLDFVNHSNLKKNAYFDVDLETGDVVLILDADVIAEQTDKLEIFISYSSIEEINKMFLTYGFIPKSEGDWKLFEVPFWGYFKGDKKTAEIVYELGQTCNLQFLVEYASNRIKTIKLSMNENFSFLALIDGIDWENLDFEQDCVNFVLEEVTGDQINVALKRLLDLVDKFCEEQEDKLAKFEVICQEFEPSIDATKNIEMLVKFQLEVYRCFRQEYQNSIVKVDKTKEGYEEYDEVFDLIQRPDKCDNEWLYYRMPPVYNFVEEELFEEREGEFGKMKI